jgi:hypothetical protein
MSANPMPASMMIPESAHPHRATPRTHHPSPRQPDPRRAIPVPVACGPGVIGPRRCYIHISLWRRWRSWWSDGRFGSWFADCHRHRRRRRRHISRSSHYASSSHQSHNSRHGRNCINLLFHNYSPFQSPIRGRARNLAQKRIQHGVEKPQNDTDKHRSEGAADSTGVTVWGTHNTLKRICVHLCQSVAHTSCRPNAAELRIG